LVWNTLSKGTYFLLIAFDIFAKAVYILIDRKAVVIDAYFFVRIAFGFTLIRNFIFKTLPEITMLASIARGDVTIFEVE
jgi:hypothetical protein